MVGTGGELASAGSRHPKSPAALWGSIELLTMHCLVEESPIPSHWSAHIRVSILNKMRADTEGCASSTIGKGNEVLGIEAALASLLPKACNQIPRKRQQQIITVNTGWHSVHRIREGCPTEKKLELELTMAYAHSQVPHPKRALGERMWYKGP